MHNLRHMARVRNCRQLIARINVIVLLKQPLKALIGLEVILLQTKDIKGLLLGNETALDSQSLFSNLFSALVSKLFTIILVALLFYKF